MKASDLIQEFPETSFSKKFNERIRLTKIPDFQIEGKKQSYKKIFYFDSLVEEIKGCLINNSETELHDYEIEKLRSFIQLDNTLIGGLNKLDFSIPGDPNSTFWRFEEIIKNERLMGLIHFKIESVEQASTVTLMDYYIDELSRLINAVALRTTKGIEIEEIKKSASELIENKEKFEEAIEKAKNWIATEEKAISIVYKKRGADFHQKATKYNSFGNTWLWLIVGIGLAISIYWKEQDFINSIISSSPNRNVGVMEGIGRLLSIILPGYFTYFCIQRFKRHQKLHEAYEFRDIAIETMNNLLKTHIDKEERAEVLARGLNIIFSEPAIKETGDEKIIEDLKDIAKSQISK